MRIALAQLNCTLGDFQGNAQRIIEAIGKATSEQADILVFPEATLFGYHPFDLLERKELVDQQLVQLSSIQRSIPAGLLVVLGAFTHNKEKKGRPYHNSAIVMEAKKKPKVFHKQLLPTGDVFDEARFIQPGDTKNNFFVFKKKKILLTICEDIWAWPDSKGRSPYLENPLQHLAKKNKVDLVINMSASPYVPEKLKQRKSLAAKTAKAFSASMVYVNMVGGQDEILFDGSSFALDKKGRLLGMARAFVEDFIICDLSEVPKKISHLSFDLTEELYQAVVLGVSDFCKKNGFKKIHLGLSGGIDSALVAVLAAQAVGPNNVKAYALPGPFSSEDSLSLAKKLAKNLGIVLQEISIKESYSQVLKTLDGPLQIKDFSVLNENLQARLRGLFLMAAGNKENSLLLSTSNKSEAATGYATLYGDMCGGLAPIGDLTKQQVYALSKWCNLQHEVIPHQIIERAPTAELRENQKDQDTLPSYAILDESVERIVTNSQSSKTATDAWLLKAIYRTEYKRWQSPPIIKVSNHSFGRGRRWPISKKITE